MYYIVCILSPWFFNFSHRQTNHRCIAHTPHSWIQNERSRIRFFGAHVCVCMQLAMHAANLYVRSRVNCEKCFDDLGLKANSTAIQFLLLDITTRIIIITIIIMKEKKTHNKHTAMIIINDWIGRVCSSIGSMSVFQCVCVWLDCYCTSLVGEKINNWKLVESMENTITTTKSIRSPFICLTVCKCDLIFFLLFFFFHSHVESYFSFRFLSYVAVACCLLLVAVSADKLLLQFAVWLINNIFALVSFRALPFVALVGWLVGWFTWSGMITI